MHPIDPGDDPAGAAGVAQGAGGAGAASGRARGRRQGLRGQRRRGAARVRLPLVQQQWRRRRRRRGRAGRAAGRVRQWRARVPDRAAGVVGLHAAVAVPCVRAGRRGRRRPAGERRLRGSGGVIVVRGGGERVEVVVGVPRLRGPAERGLRLPEPSLVRTENY